MDPFPFWEYGNENAAAEDLAMEHKQHLQTCGVRMGRGGFAVEDLHNQNALLALRVGKPAHPCGHQQVLSKADWQSFLVRAC